MEHLFEYINTREYVTSIYINIMLSLDTVTEYISYILYIEIV